MNTFAFTLVYLNELSFFKSSCAHYDNGVMLMLVYADCYTFLVLYMFGEFQPHSGPCKRHVVYSIVVLGLVNLTEPAPSALH